MEFTIPSDALQTDHDNPSDQIQWWLNVKADVPGVNYSDEFELPVFRQAQSAEAPAPAPAWQRNSSFEISSGSQTATPPESSAGAGAEVPEPELHRVAVTDSPQGLEFYFRAGRNPFRAVLVVVLAAGCGALLYGMLHVQQRPPIFALIIVGLLTFFLTLQNLSAPRSLPLASLWETARPWRCAVLGMATRQMQIADVASILAVTSIQQASSSGSTLYLLRLQTNAGKNLTLVDDIQSRQEARWIVSQIEKRAGLRLNTEVRVSDAFYGPPPQPGAASPKDAAFSRKATVRIER